MPADRRKSSSGQPDPANDRPLTASCNSCRERKVKCGGEKPRCDNCDKQDRTCEYRAKLKPGLKAGAGNVDNRIKDLQSAVRAHEAQLARLHDFLAPHGFQAGPSAVDGGQRFKSEAPSPSPSSVGSPMARDEDGNAGNGSLDPPASTSSSLSHRRQQPAMSGLTGLTPMKPLSFDGMLGPPSGSTPSSSSLHPTLLEQHLPPPSQLFSMPSGRSSQQPQPQQQQHPHSLPPQQQHNAPFASPQTAAETLLGLSGSSFMNGNDANFGASGSAAGSFSQTTGPSTGRPDDVHMREPGDVGEQLMKQLGRRSSSSSHQYPPMQLSLDQPTASSSSWAAGPAGPSFGPGLGKASFSPASFRQSGSELPPPEVISELVTLYYRHIHPWSPLVIQADEVSSGAAFNAHSPSQPSSSTRSSSSPSVLIHAIVFVTLRFSDHAHFSSHPATSKSHYAGVAKNTVLMAAMNQMSIANLQALTILALGWVHEEGGPQRWGGALSLLTGAVSHGRLGEEDRMVEDAWNAQHPEQRDKIGSRLYHATSQTSLFKVSTSWQEIEERRRLFWQIFCLDTYASLSTGFALSFNADDVHRRLPSRDGAWNKGAAQRFNPLVTEPLPSATDGAEPVSHYAYYCSIIHILGEVHNFIRAPLLLSSVADTTAWKDRYRRLSDQLLAWYAALPLAIRSVERPDWDASEGEGGIKVLVLAAYLATSVRLHSAIAYPPVSSPSFLPSDAAAAACVGASDRMAKLASRIGEHPISRPGTAPGPIDSRDLNPIFTWFIWIAARGLVAHAFIKRTPLLVDQTIVFLETLNALGAYWSTSKRYAKIIAAALNESHARQPIPNFTFDHSVPESPPEGPGFRRKDSTSSVLADMRRTAFQALATLKEEDSEEDDNDDVQHSPKEAPVEMMPPPMTPSGFGDASQPMWKHSILFPASETPAARSPGLGQQHQHQQQPGGENMADPYNFDAPLDWFHFNLFAEHDLPTYSVQASPVNPSIPLP